MHIKKPYYLLLICFAAINFPGAHGQSLQGKVIYISPSQEVMLKFRTVITNFNFSNKEESSMFEVRLTNNKNISINSTVDNFKPTNLIISEGGNTHLFILEYKQTLDSRTESMYDFSTREKLKKEAEKIESAPKEASKQNNEPDQKRASDSLTIEKPNTNGDGATHKSGGTSETYSDVIIKANKAYSAGNFDEAKRLYTQALSIKPKDPWSIFQIDAIDNRKNATRIKEQQAAIELVYKQHINTADSALNKKSYDVARSEYNKALDEKANDSYARLQLNKIDQALKEESYKSYMVIGSDALANQLFDNAEMAFNEALKSKPNDPAAKKELGKIQQARTTYLSKQKENNLILEKQNQYNDTVGLADNMFEAGLYEDAKKKYTKAERMKPGQAHVTKRLSEIESIFLKRKAEKNKLKEDSLNTLNYNKEVEKGNKAFDAKDYVKAKSAFQMAERLKPGEKYPTERISTIEVLLQQMDEKKKEDIARKTAEENNTKQYNFAIKQGNSAMKNSDYANAKVFYLQALELKPNEKFPKSQMEIVNVKLEEIRFEEKYEKFVHDADSTAWVAKDYKNALRLYDSASAMKPLASFPKKQIIAINKILLDEQTRLNLQLRAERFNTALKDFNAAETFFKEKKYGDAYTSYAQFLTKIDTTDLSQYSYFDRTYIIKAKENLIRLRDYKPKPKIETVVPAAPADDGKKKKKKKKS